MKEYDHKEVEAKWQAKWQASRLFKTSEDPNKPKSYVLDMFPYPSGDGLHVGHPKGYIATDIFSRYKHMTGHNVLHPMGWDAFGLPAEQYALKNKVHPREAVQKNTDRFKKQLAKIGFNYDWEREVNTTDPKFYKWTQWIFKQIFKAGLAHESHEPINWCPSCKTGLSNEDLDGEVCERCGTKVEKKPLRQWVLSITKYADRMLADLDKLDWPVSIKESQRNWIGKSDGSEITFSIASSTEVPKTIEHITVFTTRPDTLFGVSYIAISTELAQDWIKSGWNADSRMRAFIQETVDEEKTREHSYGSVTEKKGIDTGIFAMNPATKKMIPVWIANYILSGYGTGAIMAVPAHDERDNEFAIKYSLPIIPVIEPVTGVTKEDEEYRESIVAIVHDKVHNKFLSLDWGKEYGGSLFIGGGKERDEDDVACAIREISEETGFSQLTFIAKTQAIHHHYRAHSKGVNREIRAIGLYFELTNEEQGETQLESTEVGKFTLQWLTPEEVEKNITDELHKLCFNLLVKHECYTGEGILTHSDTFNGFTTTGARKVITEHVNGKQTSTYKLKDWVFARQRYWGEPFPIVFDQHHVPYVVADSELPVTLPEVDAYEPTGTGESPLAGITNWVEVYGYINGSGEFESAGMDDPRATLFTRETNTMPQWAGSSWYYLRYIDPTNDTAMVSKEKERMWSPVDIYVGGAEHATRHLIYARFWHKFLYDIGVVNYDEPFLRLKHVGLIQAADGRKMSKRYGNVINPDDIVETFGADSLRLYEMFMGPFDQSIAWSTDNMMGTRRMIERIWRLRESVHATAILQGDTEVLMHQTIKKVGLDIESFSFNTAISQMMIFLNQLEKIQSVPQHVYEILLQLLAPFAPHVTQELWESLGNDTELYSTTWPQFDNAKSLSAQVTIAIQVNGKLRDTIEVTRDASEEQITSIAFASPIIQKWLDGKVPLKVIYIKGKILNIVIPTN